MFSLRGTLRLPEDGEFQVCEDSTLDEICHQPDIPVGFHPFGQEGEDVKDECGILHAVGEMSQYLLQWYYNVLVSILPLGDSILRFLVCRYALCEGKAN